MNIRKIIIVVFNVIFAICLVFILWLILQIFMFASFKIPTDSMKPALKTGDHVLVWKATIGARLFNIFTCIRNEQVDIYRLPGIEKTRRNDILVFNFPHPNNWDKIEMNLLKYYIKRCVGLPGDTLSIRNGFFQVNGIQMILGNVDSQKEISTREIVEKGIYNCFPFDSIFGWNIKNFGPLYIPKKGDTMTLNYTNFRLYKKLIEWEEQGVLQYKDTMVWLNGEPLENYRFRQSYYFIAGDNGMNSQDSRYWGLLPEEFIVGKASFIWKSVDPHTGKFRWERFLKKIQ